MKLQGERIITKDLPKEEIKKGGLIVSTSEHEDKKFSNYELISGEVVFVGDLVPNFSVGEKVKYLKTAGSPILINGEEHRIMKPEGVIFKLK